MKRFRCILAVAAVALALVSGAGNEARGGGAGYMVDTTSDASLTTCDQVIDNDCSLRGAISRANAGGSAGDLIHFDAADFPSGTPAAITIATVLPSLLDGSDVIDATDRGVIVDGADEPSAFNCLNVDSNNNTVMGLRVTDCAIGILVVSGTAGNTIGPGNNAYDNTTGVAVVGGANTVKGNKIGTNFAGDTVHSDGGNTGNGVSVNGAGNTIGGSVAADGNVISGNANGIGLQASGVSNIIKGNLIGTDVTGSLDLGNSTNGVVIQDDNNIIGGASAGDRNVISGNGVGVRITGVGATGNALLGNYIGTTTNGGGQLGNGADGVFIINSGGNCIGGMFVATVCTPGATSGNLISGNGAAGMRIDGATATNNRIFGNRIGLGSGGGPLGNAGDGIRISTNSTIVGEQLPVYMNRIGNNGGDGISISSGVGNELQSNEIFGNGGLGIDLGDNGVTPNDLDDVDSGPNGLQNFPVLTSATSITTGTTIVGSLDSTPNTDFFFEFFASSSCDPSGFGEGETLIASGLGGAVTDANGDATINVTIPATVPGLRYVTAVAATDASPSPSSEFSNCVQVPPIVVNSAADPGDGTCTLANCTLREAITAANAAPELSVIHFAIGSGAQTIAPSATQLPEITNPVWINARTQPGYAGTPIIEIATLVTPRNKSAACRLTPGESIVEGLVINRFGQYGIVSNNHGNTVRGNYIGTNVAGTADLGNGLGGIALATVSSTKFNMIGGSTAADRNLISGNGGNGVLLTAFSSDNTIAGNYIGVNAAGTGALGNTQDGVEANESTRNTIGSSLAGGGNVISGNSNGVVISGPDSIQNIVAGNYIGTNAAGTAALGNSQAGVSMDGGADANTIGWITPDGRNVISGNGDGVVISGSGTRDNVVMGNFIGTDASGTIGISPSQDGVRIEAGALSNDVGLALSGAGNVISGNDTGVRVTGSISSGNAIQGNFIGTNAAGTAVVGNNFGVWITDASNTQVGGATAAARNVISGNGEVAVQIVNPGADGNVIRGNYIGTDVTGVVGLGNGGYAVLVGGDSTVIGGGLAGEGNVIAATHANGTGYPGGGIFLNSDFNQMLGNRIGTAADGTTPLGNTGYGIHIFGRSNNIIGGPGLQSNTIAYSGDAGVRVTSGGNNTGNLIFANSFFSNGGLAIDLGTEGVTLNDEGDPDTGANGLQNFPSVTGVTVSPPNVTINGLLNSKPFNTYEVYIYQSFSCDPDGFGEGANYLGLTNVTTGQFNTGGFTFNTTTAQVPPGSFITAVALGPDTLPDGTSEFGLCFTVFSDDDDDDDGYTNIDESGSPLCFNGINNDPWDDGVVDDGCFLAQVGDFSEGQFEIGTYSKDPCGYDGWPSNVFDGGMSANKLDVQDILSFVAPTRRLDKSPPSAIYNVRWDLSPGPDSPFPAFISIFDVTALLNGVSGSAAYPPMLGGLRAFGRTCPFPP